MVKALSIRKIAWLLSPLAFLGIACGDSSEPAETPTGSLRTNSRDVFRFAGSDLSRAYFAVRQDMASSRAANWRLIALDPKDRAFETINLEIAPTATQVVSDGKYVAWTDGNIVQYGILNVNIMPSSLHIDSQIQVVDVKLVNGRLAVSTTNDGTQEIRLFDLASDVLTEHHLLGRFGTWCLSRESLVLAKSVSELEYGLANFELTRVRLTDSNQFVLGESTAYLTRLGLTIDDSDGCVYWIGHTRISGGQGQSPATLYQYCLGEVAASAVLDSFDDGWPIKSVLDFLSTPYNYRVTTTASRGDLIGWGLQGTALRGHYNVFRRTPDGNITILERGPDKDPNDEVSEDSYHPICVGRYVIWIAENNEVCLVDLSTGEKSNALP